MELQEIYNRLRVDSVNDFADLLGISQSKFRNYFYSITKKVPDEVMEKARSIESSGEVEVEGRRVSLMFGPMAKVPVVGRASAGEGVSNIDEATEELWVPMSLQKIGGIGFLIDGDSMMPALQPGDVALFKETYQPRNGFTFLLKRDGEYRCKNITWRGGEWVMESLNPNKDRYPDASMVDWQIAGLLVGWYRSVGSYEKLEADPNGLRLDGPV
jgi:SOS-response transcriptional repressor LexA